MASRPTTVLTREGTFLRVRFRHGSRVSSSVESPQFLAGDGALLWFVRPASQTSVAGDHGLVGLGLVFASFFDCAAISRRS